MADISKEELRKEITAILKDADLTTMSAKKVRQQIEEKLNVDLTERKKEVDDLVMECLQEKQDGKGKEGGKKKNSKEKDEEEEDEEEEEEEEEEDEEEEEEEEEKPKPKRGGGATKKPPTKKSKKASSEDSDEASDEDISDEEYSPSKKGKGTPAKKGKGGGKKKKGSDSDSDEDWAKSRKSNSGGGGGKRGAGGGGGGGGGAKKGGNRYTRSYTLSPELAALMGQEAMPRHEVVRKIWAIIKERNLYDPKNKQFAICDDELMKVFGVKRFRTFGMMKYLKNHFVD